MAKVDLQSVSLSSFTSIDDERTTADICIEKARQMVNDILDPSESHPSRPFRIIAQVDTSSSHLVKIDIPQGGKLITKKDKTLRLRPSSFFQRKMNYQSVYFIMPSDPSLSPIQLSLEDFEAALLEQRTALLPLAQKNAPQVEGQTMNVGKEQLSSGSPNELLELSFSSLSSSSIDLPSLLSS